MKTLTWFIVFSLIFNVGCEDIRGKIKELFEFITGDKVRVCFPEIEDYEEK